MDWHAALGVLAGLIQIASAVPYIRDMLRGTTRPNAVSYILWSILTIIGIAAQVSAGASWSVFIPIAVAINAVIILTLSLIGYGYTKYGWLDWTCLGIGVVAIAGWQITGNPVVALMFVIFASAMAGIPTIFKTYREPMSEHAFAWFLVIIASILAIISTEILDTANLIFPMYLLLESATIFSLAFFWRRIKLRRSLAPIP